jgi:hypothetical protein
MLVSVSGVRKSTTMLDTLSFGSASVAALAGVGHAHFDHHVAGRAEVADLPAVHRHVVGQVLPRRLAFQKGGGITLSMKRLVTTCRRRLGGHRRLVDLLLADAGGVHVGLVRQVHQVVDHEAVVAGDVVQPPP